jgi:hypothetical protein
VGSLTLFSPGLRASSSVVSRQDPPTAGRGRVPWPYMIFDRAWKWRFAARPSPSTSCLSAGSAERTSIDNAVNSNAGSAVVLIARWQNEPDQVPCAIPRASSSVVCDQPVATPGAR